MLSNHLVGMRPAARADDPEKVLDIVRDTVKIQTHVISLSGEHGVFCPGIGMKLVFGQKDVIGPADAAPIEEQPLAEAAHQLRVGVASIGLEALALTVQSGLSLFCACH